MGIKIPSRRIEIDDTVSETSNNPVSSKAVAEWIKDYNVFGNGRNAPNFERVIAISDGYTVPCNGYLYASFPINTTADISLKVDNFTVFLFSNYAVDTSVLNRKRDGWIFPVNAKSVVSFQNCGVTLIYGKDYQGL